MKIDFLEQSIWGGIAKRTPESDDHRTSQIEMNTEPGEDEFRRLSGRKPYLNARMPSPAIRFLEGGSYLKCMDDTGTAPDFSESGSDFTAIIAFKWDGHKDNPVSDEVFLAGAINGEEVTETSDVSWCLYFYKDGSDWKIRANIRSGPSAQHVLSPTGVIAEDTWYLAYLGVDWNGTPYLAVYDTAGDVHTSLGSPMTGASYTGTYNLYLGGHEYNYNHTFFKGEIAYFELRNSFVAYSASITWETSFATKGTGNCFFYPHSSGTLRSHIFVRKGINYHSPRQDLRHAAVAFGEFEVGRCYQGSLLAGKIIFWKGVRTV